MNLMDASEQASVLANVISDGINHLAYIRSLRAEPPLVSAAELEEWGGIFDRTQSALAEIQTSVHEGRAQTSLPLTSDAVRSLADVRAHLSTIAPGTQLPASLFDLVEIAWSEFMKASG
ncbi:MAG: hypothetical protein ABJE95_18865 [Byssovorax sp.]